jgi:hypothetical protein
LKHFYTFRKRAGWVGQDSKFRDTPQLFIKELASAQFGILKTERHMKRDQQRKRIVKLVYENAVFRTIFVRIMNLRNIFQTFKTSVGDLETKFWQNLND